MERADPGCFFGGGRWNLITIIKGERGDSINGLLEALLVLLGYRKPTPNQIHLPYIMGGGRS